MTNMNERDLVGPQFKRHKATEEEKKEMGDWTVWECADPKFDYVYESSVTMFVEEGEAHLKFSDNTEVDIQFGDTLTIKNGSVAVWTIESSIRNVYFYHDEF